MVFEKLAKRISDRIDPIGGFWFHMLCCFWIIDCCGFLRPSEMKRLPPEAFDEWYDQEGQLNRRMREDYIRQHLQSSYTKY